MSEPFSEPQGRRPPQDLEAERSVLGAILLSNDSLDVAHGIVKPDDFYLPAHQKLYEAMVALWGKHSAVDIVTLGTYLADHGDLVRVGGHATLVGLTATVPTAANVRHYAEIVRGKSVLRRLIKAGTEIVARGFSNGEPEEMLDEAEASVLEIRKESASRGVVHIKDALTVAFQEIERLQQEKLSITGVPTGYEKLDFLTAGLQRSDLIIIAGRPAMGKTAFALNVGTHAAIKGGAGVAVFSLEMSKEQLVKRMLCSEGRINATAMRRGDLRDGDWPKMAKAAGALSDAKIFLDDAGSLTVLDARAKCRRIAAEHGLGLVIIDYLQLMRGGPRAASREQEISEISRGLKALAKELNIPIIALSQLNRSLETRPDKRPVLSDLRESGAIEQDADIIMFVYRDEYYNPESEDKGLAEVIIAKQRSGPTGKVKLRFFNEFTRFESLAE